MIFHYFSYITMTSNNSPNRKKGIDALVLPQFNNQEIENSILIIRLLHTYLFLFFYILF